MDASAFILLQSNSQDPFSPSSCANATAAMHANFAGTSTSPQNLKICSLANCTPHRSSSVHLTIVFVNDLAKDGKWFVCVLEGSLGLATSR